MENVLFRMLVSDDSDSESMTCGMYTVFLCQYVRFWAQHLRIVQAFVHHIVCMLLTYRKRYVRDCTISAFIHQSILCIVSGLVQALAVIFLHDHRL